MNKLILYVMERIIKGSFGIAAGMERNSKAIRDNGHKEVIVWSHDPWQFILKSEVIY